MFFSLLFLFLICRAGTGKSWLLKKLIKRQCLGSKSRRKRVYLVNVDQAELQCYKKIENLKIFQISLNQLDEAKPNSLIVIEDIIHMNNAEEINLRKALNYNAHHKLQKIICISHMSQKTGIWACLSFFHYIIFTSDIANVTLIRPTFNYFKLEKNVINCWLKKYKELCKEGVYFFYDCRKMNFNTLFVRETKTHIYVNFEKIASPDSERNETPSQKLEYTGNDCKKKLQERFEKIVSDQTNASQASALFSIIINCANIA